MYQTYHVTVDFLQGLVINCYAYLIILTCSKVRRMCQPQNPWGRSLQDDLTGSQTRQITAGAWENCQPKVAKISETQQKKPITAYELLTVNIAENWENSVTGNTNWDWFLLQCYPDIFTPVHTSNLIFSWAEPVAWRWNFIPSKFRQQL